MAILPAFPLILSRLSIWCTSLNALLRSFLLMKSCGIIMTGSAGLPTFFLVSLGLVNRLFHVKQLNRKELIFLLEMFRKVLQALVDYICNFALDHPRLVWVIAGSLCVYAFACAVISLLIGG